MADLRVQLVVAMQHAEELEVRLAGSSGAAPSGPGVEERDAEGASVPTSARDSRVPGRAVDGGLTVAELQSTVERQRMELEALEHSLEEVRV